MPKRGRPKVKKAEFKKPFAMRFSEEELKSFKTAAGKLALRQWMRDSLVATAGGEPLTVEKIAEWAKAHPEKAAAVFAMLGDNPSSTSPSK